MSSFSMFSFALLTEQIEFFGAVLFASFNESAKPILNPFVKVVKGYNKKAPPAVKQVGQLSVSNYLEPTP